MNSSMIGKIEKARWYAAEPERAQIDQLQVRFRGEHDTYELTYDRGTWSCSCHSYSALQLGTCSHIMAMERLLGVMIPAGVASGVEVTLV